MLGGFTHMLDDFEAAVVRAEGALSPPPPPPPPLSVEADAEEGDEQLEACGTAVEPAGVQATHAHALSTALAHNGWSLERVMSELTAEMCDKLIESMPFAASYTGGHPEAVEQARRRMLNTDGVVPDTGTYTRHRRSVANIPTIDIGGTSIYDPWQMRANANAALASGYGRSEALTTGIVRDASTWIEAIAQLEPVLNRDPESEHPFVQHAQITAFLVQLATARALRARPVRAADIAPPAPPAPPPTRKRRAAQQAS